MSTPPQIFFFFLSGSRKGKIESADAQVVRIGRQPYCEVKLDPFQDIPASGDHCHVIREEDGTYYVLDSGSTFGTWLNGNQIQGRVKLSTGDVIECGRDENGGRFGPRLKFYLETDIRKCPICSGPVYKRNFRCPDCGKKTCLRCIDFNKKVCTRCAAAPVGKARSSGFEVVEDDNVRAKRPAKVILSGKEAAKVKKKQAEKEATRTKRPDGITKGFAAKDDLSVPFCLICQDFVKGNPFVCPACGREICASHKQGKVCMPCAGVSPDPIVKKTKLARPAPSPADLEADDLEAEPIVAEAVPPSSIIRAERPADKATRAAPTPAPAPRPAPIPRTEEEAPPATVRQRLVQTGQIQGAQKKGTSEIKQPGMPPAVKTGVASCARCRGPLGAGTFCCRACRRIQCFLHVAVDDVCEDCYLAGRDRGAGGGPAAMPPTTAMPRPAPFFPPDSAPGGPGPGKPTRERPPGHRTSELPSSAVDSVPGAAPPEWDSERGATISEIEALDMMPLLDTERDEDANLDDDLARPPPGTSAADHDGLIGLSFVCPHCDAPLDASARACPRCRKVL